ncbi:hypothetical protein JST97_28825 [bacterium]|nr:hypothetical protein [bacterium]
MIHLDAARARTRYAQAKQDILTAHPDGRVLSTGMPAQPFDTDHPDSEVFFGAHVDNDPRTEDRVELWSSKKNDGGEEILREVFVERQERPSLLSWSKTSVLHCYVHRIQSPGGIHHESEYMKINQATGEVLDRASGGKAMDKIWNQGLDR